MPQSLNQVLLLVAFIIPGFIVIRVKRLSYPAAEESIQGTLLDSLALSCIVHGVCSPVWYLSYVYRTYLSQPKIFGLQVFAILFVVPVLLGVLYNLWSGTDKARWLRRLLGVPHPIPVAWDYHFRKRRPLWVWLTFKSGQVMAGLFGPSSFASSFPHRQDLYIEKLLRLDSHAKVQGWRENSAGALVRMHDLERVEFFDVEGVMP